MDHGYAVVDLEILNPSKVEDICLSRFVSLLLQFISQRHRPVRGSTSKLPLDYIRTFPCKINWFQMRQMSIFWKSLRGESWSVHCRSCVVSHNMVAEVRHMIEADWLYLAKLLKYSAPEMFKQQGVVLACITEQITESTTLCVDYARMAAQKALLSLKSIPVAARRSLLVLVNQQGHLLSIPSTNVRHCPCLVACAEFKPRVPLGGGHSSFI
ncbi:tRNA(Ile)-lysidine synthase [Quillaja saponaria]|uniref:tRNA(Ile)-lysidine synthase n=1 Tax=Quillaja saponaria TaxID=32244 RepID=A0AAD7Q2Y2_QUISA|nr:tRNA(Ile)-lysidine synthase [Quillaja saponaria]